MIPKRPINADVPAPEEKVVEEKAQSEEPLEEPKPRGVRPLWPRGRQRTNADESKPGAPKALAALVVLALAFIAAAVVFGNSGEGDQETSAAAPAPAPASGEDSGSDSGEDDPSATVEGLGYPGFATNNTVRIGGSDPVANAAATALAVFPSTTPAQRPAAVTLVGEEDWAGAIAASVLMAPPVQAPILFSGPGEMPDVSEEALAALDPQGSDATGNASLFTVGRLAYPGQAVPIDSGEPASTAAQIATLRERLAGKPPEHLLIASSAEPGFAMPAAAWAARSGDPVLYASRDELPAATAGVLREHPKVPVYVLGPATAISKAVLREIGKISKRVRRVGGKDEVASALALARYHDGKFGWNVNDPGHGFVLARSDSPGDAAAAAPLSASGTWGPLLLTDDADTLPPLLRSYFLDVKPGYTTDPTRAFYNHVWVVGDSDAISVAQQAEVDELAELAKIGDRE